jgi:hypothetical protein
MNSRKKILIALFSAVEGVGEKGFMGGVGES